MAIDAITDAADPRLEAVEAAVVAGDIGRAVMLAEQALAQGLRHPALFNLRAFKAEQAGRLEAALADLQSALALAPDDASILNALGIAYTGLERNIEAVEALRRATTIAPNFPQAWNNRGLAEQACGDLAAAKASFEHAAALAPAFAEPRGRLALFAARRGALDEARRWAQATLAIRPNQSEAVRALAQADLAESRAAEAESRLRSFLQDPQQGPIARAYAHGMLGDALDRQDRVAEAFEAYLTANATLRECYAPQFGRSGILDQLEAVRDMFAATWPRGVEADEPDEPSPARQHIFLIGFMRLGTTLMEQVLAAQPDAVGLEEKEVLTSGVMAYLRRPDDLRRLAAAPPSELAAHRADYWARVRAHGVEPEGKVFVDKMPFDGFRLPLIHKLFPKAKIVLAIRDPRDVVFSCFRHRFAVTTYTYELLTLASAVRLYDLFMSSVEVFDARLPIAMHRYRHEDLVDDFDGQVRALCDFLETPWRESMRDIGARARGGLVTSPSAPQLLGGLSRQGLQQWRRYAAQLEPHLGGLGHWVRKLGYDPA